MTDLTQDEAIDRACAIAVESYDIFLDLTAEPVLSRAEVRFRWLRPEASTFAELRTQGVRGVTLGGVSLPPSEDGRLRLSRAGGGDQAEDDRDKARPVRAGRPYCFMPTPPQKLSGISASPSLYGHRAMSVTPGTTRSSPSKNRVISARVRGTAGADAPW